MEHIIHNHEEEGGEKMGVAGLGLMPYEQEEEDPLGKHYEEKPREDYLKIIRMIEAKDGNITRVKIMEELQIPGEVLDAFFDVALRECTSDPERQNFICDRLVEIQGDRVPEIAKKLKLQSFRLKDEISALRSLQKDYDEKSKELARLQEIVDAGGAGKETSRVSELESECELLRDRIKELEMQLQEFSGDTNTDDNDGSNELERLRGEVFELQQNKDDLESQVRSLQAQIEDNGGDADQEQLQEQINELQEQLETVEKDKRELQTKVFSLAEQLEEAEKKGGSSGEDEVLREQIDALHQARRLEQQTIEELQEKIEDLEAEISERDPFTSTRHDVTNPDQENIFENQAEIPETKRDKKKSGPNIWLVMLGVGVALAVLFFVVVRILTPTEVAPVQGEPTPVVQTTQAPISTPVATQAIPVSNEQVQQALPGQALPTATVVSTLNTPDDFRRAALGSMKINEMGELVIDAQAYKPGEMINGFKLILVQKSFIRLQDSKSGLQFRVDMGV